MRAMLLKRLGALVDHPSPLELATWPDPEPGPGEIVLGVRACAVCHTELDEIEGRTPPPRLPIIPGHQVVGRVEALGAGVAGFKIGDRVGVAWIYSACGRCAYCLRGLENLCPQFRATGRDADGGYAERMAVPAAFAHPLPDALSDLRAAPLLCAGAVGYRAVRLSGIEDGQSLGLSGFGASAHLVLQLVRAQLPRARVFVFARADAERAFARQLGASWAGDFSEKAPQPLDAIIDTTPAWTPIVRALENLAPGGRLVVNAIRKQDADRAVLQSLDYARHLWLEKECKSVANVTRFDVRELLRLAAQVPVVPEIQEYALDDANRALVDLQARHVRGAKVLRIS